jgi:hypothetical protein
MDPVKGAYQDNPEIKRQADIIKAMGIYENATPGAYGGPQSPEDMAAWLKENFGLGDTEVKKMQAQYALSKSFNNKGIPVEGWLGMEALRTRYNMSLTTPQQEALATGIAQGLPYQQVATTMLSAAGFSPATTEASAGKLIEYFGDQGYGSAQLELLNQGAQRWASLGGLMQMPTQGLSVQELERQYSKANLLGGREWDLFSQEVQNERLYGMAGQPWQRPDINKYLNKTTDWQQGIGLVDSYTGKELGDEEWMQKQIELSISNQRGQLALQTSTSFYRLGMQAPSYAGMTNAGISQMGAQANYGFSLEQQLQGYVAPQQAQSYGQAFARMDPQSFNMYSGMLSWDPRANAARALMAQRTGVGMEIFQGTLPGYGGAQIPMENLLYTDYNDKTGQLTGLPYGTTSLALPGMYTSAQQAGNIWGQDWQTNPNLSQGLINSMIEGGTRGGQLYQTNLGYQNQMAMLGIQEQQWQLQMTYQPQFWAIEDKMRALGYEQQEWGFTMQQKQIDMSRQQFGESMALTQKQAYMQRTWAQEDWGYQDTVRGLQWQWKQEDYQENIRFTTGRERRLGERQMERDTIMFNLEGEHIDTQRKRQEELWKLEDQRFELSKKQHEEQLKLQEENLAKQRQFFEERKKLEEQQVKLQRQYWQEQMDLQKKSMDIQRAYLAEQHKINLTMIEYSNHIEDVRASLNLLNNDSLATMLTLLEQSDPLFQAFLQNLNEMNVAMGGSSTDISGGGTAGATSGTGSGTGTGTGTNTTPTGPPQRNAGGGFVMPGVGVQMGEFGYEVLVSDRFAEVVPANSKTHPWANSVLGDSPAPQGEGSGPMTVIVNIGNEHLGKFVIDTVEKEVEVHG